MNKTSYIKHHTSYILAAAIFQLSIFSFQFAHAQEEGTYNESVLVRGSYRPVIEEPEKLSFPAVVTDTLDRVSRTFSYHIAPSRVKALYQPSLIKAARIVGEPTTKLYNNYLRLGLGNYWSPLADLYLCSTRDTARIYGLRLNHRSSWGSLPDYGKNHFGLTDIALFGKLIAGRRLQLHSDLSYQHDHNLYYGFTDDELKNTLGLGRDDLSLNDIRAHYNRLAWNIGLRNLRSGEGRLGYSADLRLADLWASWGQNEFALTLGGDIHYGFDLRDHSRGIVTLAASWQGFAFRHNPDADQMPLGYNPLALTQSASQSVSHSRNIVALNPHLELLYRGFQLHAGITAVWDGYTNLKAQFRLFPDIVITRQLLDGALAASLAATGGLQPNSLDATRLVNPYLAPGAEQRATQHYDFTGALRWTLSRKLEANFQLQYSLLNNDLTFTLHPDYTLQNVYLPFYFDDKRLTLGADIAFVNDEMLTLRAAAHYYRYTAIHYNNSALAAGLNYFHAPLYRPDFDCLLAADVNYRNRWLFHLETGLLGKMRGDLGENLPLRLGIGAEIEYRHNRALSFFLRLDNLALQRYYYWTNYPSQRGLFLLGITYTL